MNHFKTKREGEGEGRVGKDVEKISVGNKLDHHAKWTPTETNQPHNRFVL